MKCHQKTMYSFIKQVEGGYIMYKFPLVSICIPNYNYAQYLEHCLDSACNQSYKNIEILFNDNASTDYSWDIAVNYKKKYGKKFYFSVGQNKYNVGSDANCVQLMNKAQGKYMMFLSSDDAINYDFISNCVEVMEKHPTVGLVMTDIKEIDEQNFLVERSPFFNKSFFCPGEDMAAVYMMAGIAVPSQCLMRRSSKLNSLRFINYSPLVAGDWLANFALSCVCDVAYLKEAMTEYRVHRTNETSESEKNMTAIYEHYLLINIFMRMANNAGFTKPQQRYHEAVEKLGNMCLRYARKMLLNNEVDIAQKYLKLSEIFKKGITSEELYLQLNSCINAGNEQKQLLLAQMASSDIIRRTVSYDPPENFVAL